MGHAPEQPVPTEGEVPAVAAADSTTDDDAAVPVVMVMPDPGTAPESAEDHVQQKKTPFSVAEFLKWLLNLRKKSENPESDVMVSVVVVPLWTKSLVCEILKERGFVPTRRRRGAVRLRKATDGSLTWLQFPVERDMTHCFLEAPGPQQGGASDVLSDLPAVCVSSLDKGRDFCWLLPRPMQHVRAHVCRPVPVGAEPPPGAHAVYLLPLARPVTCLAVRRPARGRVVLDIFH